MSALPASLQTDGLWPLVFDQVDGEQLPWQRPQQPLPFNLARICDHLDTILYALGHPLFDGGVEWTDGAIDCAQSSLGAPLAALRAAIPPSDILATWPKREQDQIAQLGKHVPELETVSSTTRRGKDAIRLPSETKANLKSLHAQLVAEHGNQLRSGGTEAELRTIQRCARQLATALESNSNDVAVLHTAAACLPTLIDAAWRLNMLLPVRIDAVWPDWGRLQVRYPSGYLLTHEDHVGCSHDELLLGVRTEVAVAIRQWCDELDMMHLVPTADTDGSSSVVADPSAYVSASDIIRLYTPAKMAISLKQLATILKNNPIKWYRPKGQRRHVHLADWMKFIAQQDEDGLLSEEYAAEAADRVAELRRRKK